MTSAVIALLGLISLYLYFSSVLLALVVADDMGTEPSTLQLLLAPFALPVAYLRECLH